MNVIFIIFNKICISIIVFIKVDYKSWYKGQQGLVVFTSELYTYCICLLAWPIDIFHLCHSNNLLIISSNTSLRNNEVFNNIRTCKLPINKMNVKKSKKMIMYSIRNNQRERIDFIISSGNYYKRILIFSFTKSFDLKYTTFVILHPHFSYTKFFFL